MERESGNAVDKLRFSRKSRVPEGKLAGGVLNIPTQREHTDGYEWRLLSPAQSFHFRRMNGGEDTVAVSRSGLGNMPQARGRHRKPPWPCLYAPRHRRVGNRDSPFTRIRLQQRRAIRQCAAPKVSRLPSDVASIPEPKSMGYGSDDGPACTHISSITISRAQQQKGTMLYIGSGVLDRATLRCSAVVLLETAHASENLRL
jgi:hypothetical protein